MLCPNCQFECPPDFAFCPKCGTALQQTCAQCGYEAPPDFAFCPKCGSPLAAPPEEAVPTPEARPMVERLQRLVPKEYAERLLATRGQVGHERRTVTILFSDVKGSTAMAGDLDPEEWVEIMQGAFDLLIEPVYRYEGTVARLMGDAIVAFFGAPIAHEDDAQRAVLAALDIIAGAREYATRLEQERGIAGFNVRVGINTGLVVAGEVGSDLRMEYTAMGDAVNVAARMEQNAPPGGVLITDDTYRQVRGVFDVSPQEPLAVKGKAEPVQTYLVEGARSRAFRKPARGVEGIETRMVGRKAELKHLQEALFTAIEDGELQAVTVAGEVGVGKSRLLHEFDVWAELLPRQLCYFKGRAIPEMRNRPYGLIQDLVATRFQIQDSDTAAAVREKLEAGVGAASAGEGDGDQEQVAMRAHLIGHLVGFEVGESPYLVDVWDDPQQVRDQALAHLAGYFRGMAGQLPVLILLEDLQWADDSSLDALNYLALALSEQQLIMASTARPELFERRPHWGEGQSFHTRLDLQPLSLWDSRRLVGEILQRVDQVPETLRDLIVAGAEGNPFFIEELVKMLVEDGVIVKGEQEWQVEPSRLTEIRVPPTLTGILQARVDRLPPEERTVLQQASVVGRLFWDRAVIHVNASAGEGIEESEVTARLSALRGREMVFQRETSAFAGAQEYIFKHALLREVTYESLLKRLRRAYHGLVADWLLAEAGDRAEEYSGLIADHLELAGRTDEAAEYLLQAGDRARRQYANEEALTYFRRALGLLEDALPDASLRKVAGGLYERLGDVLELSGEYVEARAAYQNALARTPADDRIGQGRLHRKTGEAWRSPRRFERAMQAYDRAEAALGKEPVEASAEWWQEWMEIQLERTNVHYFRGEVRELAELVERIQPVVEQHGTPLQRAGFFLTVVLEKNRRDRFVVSEQTLAHSRAYLEAAQESGSLYWLAHARFVLGFNLLWHGKPDEAEEQINTALELAVQMGRGYLQTQCLTYLTVVHRKSGQVEEVRDLSLRSLEAATSVQNPAYIGAAQANLAWAAWKEADLAEALERGNAALEPWQQSETGFMFQWLALFPLTSVALTHDRIPEAVKYARGLLESAQQALPDPLQTVLEGAIEAWESGEPEATRRYFDRALELAQEMGYL